MCRPRARTMTVPDTAAMAVANTTVLVLEFVFNIDEAIVPNNNLVLKEKSVWCLLNEGKQHSHYLYMESNCIIKHFSWLRVCLFGRFKKDGYLEHGREGWTCESANLWNQKKEWLIFEFLYICVNS